MNFEHNRIGVKLILLSILLPAGSTIADEADDSSSARLFQAQDIFELEYASDPQISSDGRRIVYVRNRMDIMSDSSRANLWTINANGSGHRPLLSSRDSYSSPRFSPGGERLLYLSGAEGSSQLYMRWMDSGQTALLSNLTASPGSLSWSPDGKWIAFTMDVPASKEPLAAAPAKPENAKWAAPVKVIDQLVYRVDGRGYLKTSFTHIFVLPAEGGSPRQLTSGDFNHDGPLSWTADAEHIVFSANRLEDWEYHPSESELYTINVKDSTLKQLTTRKGPDSGPTVSPNGQYIAYTGFDDREQGYQLTKLYLMDLKKNTVRNLSVDFDRSVQNPQWSGNNRLLFQYDDRGVRKLASTNLSGNISTIAENVGGTYLGRPYTSGSYSVADNGSVAYTMTSPHHPADVAVARNKKSRKITALNDDIFGHKQLAEIEELTWSSSFDEREIQGWIARPPGFDPAKKYPLILEIHGGPFAAYGPNFSVEVQRYAAEGYVVLYANPRGSTSYGEEFGNLIHHDYPGNDYDDLMSGVDAILKSGYIDENNIFVTGGSGGGVLTAWTVGKTDRFNAAVVAKPVINQTSFALTADYVNYFYKYWFASYPWEDPDEYWRRSPLSLVGNVSTPTMLLTGEADLRTPISESEQFYVALKLRRIDTILLRVPGSSHGIASRPSNQIAKIDNILAWFKRYRTDMDKEEMEE
ncbi:MAG: prolyl oligopeptidase family serine peptidase [Gammaproteobacteria bacterium]|nr:prolyl oligopeptidase family serine peptidase [Gammaproteobacteria bacterium]